MSYKQFDVIMMSLPIEVLFYIKNLFQCRGVSLCYDHRKFGNDSFINKEIILISLKVLVV